VAQAKDGSDPRVLAASIADRAPRVLVLSAPAGYRKGALLRAYAERAGPLLTCYLPPGADLARAVLDALVAGDRSRAARSAADRLAQRPEAAAANSREALRREWPLAERAALFALRDVSGQLATPGGADLFEELVAALPGSRTLAVSTRTPLPPALAQIVERERSMTVGIADLALSAQDVDELARRAGLPADAAAAIYDVAAGWPLVSRLLVGLLPHDSREEILEAAAALAPDSMLAFAAHRTIARLPEPVREALVVAMLLHGASHVELVRVLGDACDDLVFARLSSLPFVEPDGERVIVHPEISALLRTRFESLIKALYERTLHVLTGDGAYVAAARVALDGGDGTRAAAIIDAAPPYTSAPVPLGEYERIIDRIDGDLITRFPNVWIATIPYRTFHVERAAFVREAETVYYCLPHGTRPELRAAALMLLASAYANIGRTEEANGLVDEALRGFAAASSPARVSVLNFAASLRGIEGRFSLARALAGEAAGISRHSFGEDQTLHYIDMHEAAFKGKNDRVVVIVDELLRRLEPGELPLHRANAATNGALVTWVNGDDESFQRYIATLADTLTPGIERGFAPMIDAARGRAAPFDARFPGPLLAAVGHLYRLGWTESAADALEAARAAVSAADERRDPYVQIVAHTALYVLDEPVRAREAATLEAIVASVESTEMQDAVRALVRGKPAGILEAYVRRRVLRERPQTPPRTVVELFAGRVTRDSQPIRFSDKEFELLALLASSHGALSRDRIGEALWDHLDPEEWPNNLKVTTSRIRTKLAMRDGIVVADGRYRLSPMIDVDLRRAETVVRESDGGALDDRKRGELRAIVAAYRSGAVGRYDRFPWVQPLLARIDDLLCTAGTALAGDAFANGRFDEAVAHASEIAAIDPFNETVCEVTMRVLAARGDLDGARRELRRYAASLADELGAAPSARLTALARELGIAGAERLVRGGV
jgi:DNA-binding SARP family transcriptional activator